MERLEHTKGLSYDFEKYNTIRKITKTYNNSNIYYLIDEESITKDFKEVIKAAKNGNKVEISKEKPWNIQEFENFYYHDAELKSKEEYTLTYDNKIVANDDVVFCEDIQGFLHRDSAFDLDNEGIYYADDIDLVYSFLEDTYIHTENVAFVLDAQGHRQPIHIDNLANYYFEQ